MNAETFIALLVFLFPLAQSPGPGNAFFAAIGASKGVRATVRALAGYHIATLVVTVVLGDPDVLLPGDSAVRSGAYAAGLPSHAVSLTAWSARVSPWRSYLTAHLWKHGA